MLCDFKTFSLGSSFAFSLDNLGPILGNFSSQQAEMVLSGLVLLSPSHFYLDLLDLVGESHFLKFF